MKIPVVVASQVARPGNLAVWPHVGRTVTLTHVAAQVAQAKDMEALIRVTVRPKETYQDTRLLAGLAAAPGKEARLVALSDVHIQDGDTLTVDLDVGSAGAIPGKNPTCTGVSVVLYFEV